MQPTDRTPSLPAPIFLASFPISWSLFLAVMLALPLWLYAGSTVNAQTVRDMRDVEKLPARERKYFEELRARPEFRQATEEEFMAIADDHLKFRRRAFEIAKQHESANLQNIVGSISTAVSCAEGYISARNIRPSAQDVEIFEERRDACDARGCKTLQVSASRPNETPFDLSVSLSCSG